MDQDTRNATEALRTLILRTALSGFWQLDMHGRIVEVNEAYCRMSGYGDRELVGRHISELDAVDDEAAVAARMAEIRSSGGAVFETRHRRKDGTLYDVEASVQYQSAAGGRMVVFFRDITANKRFEATLAFLARSSPAAGDFFRSLARYIAEALDMGFVCIDRLDGDRLTAHTLAVYSNGRFEDNVSYALKDTPCGEVVGRHVCCFPDSIKTRFPRDAVLQRMEAESYIGVTLWSHDGRPIGLIAVIGARPLADRAQAEALLKLVAVRAAGELERLGSDEARRAAVAALQEREERLRFVLEGGRIGSWDWDLVANTVQRNHIWAEMLGYTAEEIRSTTQQWTDFVHPDDRELAWASIRDCLEGRKPVHEAEYRMRTKGGDYAWILDRARVVRRDQDGRPLRMSGTHADITDRKRAEEELLESRRRLAFALRGGRLGLWDWRPQTGAVVYSELWAGMLGYRPDEVEPRVEFFTRSVHPDDLPAVLNRLDAHVAGRAPAYVSEHRLRRKGGDWIWVHDQGEVAERDATGRPVRVSGVIADITDRKRAEAALRDGEDRFRAFADATMEGVLIHDKGVILDVNARFLSIFGYERPDELLGRQSLDFLMTPESREQIVSLWRRGRSSEMEVSGIRKDGSRVLLVTNSRPLTFRDRDARVVTFRDVTEQRKVEERLRHSEKMTAIGQLAGGVAHDFNNQLVGVLGYAEMLEERLADSNLKRYAGNIRTAARRAADLTRQLLAFSRKGKYLSVPVDLHKVVAEVVALLSHSLDKKIELHQHLDANPSTVLGDPTQLQNALLNLAVNASDAMPDGGRLSFATAVVVLQADPADPDMLAGRHVQVRVADTGAGMDAGVMKRLFEPFFTTKAVGKGTGLGLAAVHGAVKNHHGTIRVESRPGEGSAFTICLPVHEEAGPASGGEYPVAPRRGEARVLVVDDEELVRELAADLLRDLGYKVVTCVHGEEAIGYYRQSWAQVDLVILDMVMPRMGGKETFIAMRAINPGVKAILSSGHSIAGEAQGILDEGVLAFVQKPFARAELAEKVSAALSAAGGPARESPAR